MRLIDADELIDAFKAWKNMDDYYHDTDCNDIPFSEAFDLIDNAPTISPEKALMEKMKGSENISCGTCKYADYYYQLEPCKTCINNSARGIHYTKWEEAENEID